MNPMLGSLNQLSPKNFAILQNLSGRGFLTYQERISLLKEIIELKDTLKEHPSHDLKNSTLPPETT
jgi:hypothetical protein|tara:strand:- start:108 stop:305 length:198 start_codon:yes stop_codon:yes gene_type:complete